MKTSASLITLLLGLAIPGMGWAEPEFADSTRPILTESEADRVVREELAVRDQIHQARLEHLDGVSAVQRYWVETGGRRVLFNHVAPPESGDVQPSAKDADRPISEEISPGSETLEPLKPHHTVLVSGVRGDDGLFELEWSSESHGFKGVSGFDLQLLPAFLSIETDTATYTFTLLLSPTGGGLQGALRSDRDEIRMLLAGEEVGYVLLNEPSDVGEEPALHAMDVLHGYVAVNQDRLRRERQDRLAIEAARQRLLEASPPTPRDTAINFSPRSR